MNFSISKDALQKILRVVSAAAERRQQHNPVLANVFFEVIGNALQAVATDQEIELTATAEVNKVNMPGRALIPCRKLNDICRVLPDSAEITIDSQAEKTLVKAGRSKFVLSAMATDQFPKITSGNEQQRLNIPRTALLRLLEKTAFAMAEEDVRYYLNGMLFEVGVDFLRTVAADGHRLALQTLAFQDVGVEPSKIIIPRKAVLEMLRLLRESAAESATLTFAGSHLQLECAELSLTTVLLGGKYPDYDKVIPARGDKVVRGNREVLKEAIIRASTLLNDKFKGIRMKFTPEELQISAYNSEKDEAEEHVAVDFEGEEIEMGFNARYLLDFISSADAEKITMTIADVNGSALLEEVGDNSGVCVIMPMRM